MNTHTLQRLFEAEFDTKLNLEDVLRFVEDRNLHLDMELTKDELVERFEGVDLSEVFDAGQLLRGLSSREIWDWLTTTLALQEIGDLPREDRDLKYFLVECTEEELREALEIVEDDK